MEHFEAFAKLVEIEERLFRQENKLVQSDEETDSSESDQSDCETAYFEYESR